MAMENLLVNYLSESFFTLLKLIRKSLKDFIQQSTTEVRLFFQKKIT